MSLDLPEGIYFGLPEDEYHALPRLSASGIKTMMTSVEDFWDESWMNPLRVRRETAPMTLGNAYHKRILEGSAAFYGTHCAALDKADYDGLIVTSEDLKAALAARNLPTTGKRKQDQIDRLLDADPGAPIWDVLVERHIAANEGKVMLPPDVVQRIEYAAAFIEKHPVLGKAFTGGQPEVTILWTDAEFGVRMKARLDYLKVKAIIDLKTFSNSSGKFIDSAVYGSIASRRYHVQAAVYLDAIEYARSLYAEGAVYGDHDPEWLGKCMRTKEHKFMFVFQKSDGAPLVRARTMPRRLTLDSGRTWARSMIEMFGKFMDAFGDEGTPWMDLDAIGIDPQTGRMAEIEDEAMPQWAFG